ncbi:MAG: nucleoside triphosphate pyrophosphohydrolase [Hyphomicrobiales bacterium]|nr:nucleoside triphosphate pyrophosphohydrolase [Hyphomicrobiales bacterium]
MEKSRDISVLLQVMEKLRSRDGGCPWDIEQTFETIAPYTIEEAAEVVDAIARGDMLDLKDELGDLLLQVVFHARMAQEQGLFDFGSVVEAITAKMIRRHPHVFGNAGSKTQDEVNTTWAQIKAQEKAERATARASAGLPPDEDNGVLAGVPAALPALARAVKLQSKASTVGFDWNDPLQVLAKIREECDELETEIRRNNNAAISEETGDLLFAVANLARHAGVDAEAALRQTNEKFRRRFAYIETALEQRGVAPEDAGLAAMDALWDEAKKAERKD